MERLLLTVATPFQGGEDLERWLGSLDALILPRERALLLWLDNSRDPAWHRRLKAAMRKRRGAWAKCLLLQSDAKIAAQFQSQEVKSRQVSLMWQALRHAVEGDYLLCLESDVLPPPAAGDLWRHLLQDERVAAVSAVVPWEEPVAGLRVLAWDIEQEPSFPGDPVIRDCVYRVRWHWPVHTKGPRAISATGFGCLWVRTKSFREASLTGDRPGLAYDQQFGVEMWERGEQVLVDWSVRCGHLKPLASGELVELRPPAGPKVGVVIPCTDEYVDYLPEAIASVESQSYEAIRWIVVAYNHRQRVLEAYPDAADAGELGPEPGALSQARNLGASALDDCDLLMFLDADDKLLGQAVQDLVDGLERNPQAAAVFGPVQEFGATDRYHPIPPRRPSLVLGLDGPWVVPPASALIRARAFRAVGGFPTDAPDELPAFWAKMFQDGWVAVPIEAAPLLHRTRPGGGLGVKVAGSHLRQHLRQRYPRAFARAAARRFVAALNRNAFARRGGDTIQYEGTRDGLIELGCVLDLREPGDCLADYELVHVWHLNAPWSRACAEWAARQRKPYVVSSILYRLAPAAGTDEEALYVICASEGEREQVARMVKRPDRTVVVPMGVRPEFILPQRERPSDLPEGRYALVVGRLGPEKGLLDLCRALEPEDNIPLVAIGDHRADDLYTAECKRAYPHLAVLGPRRHADMPAYYQHAHVVISPSHWESYGLTLLEAQAAGANLVVTRKSLAWRDFAEFASVCDPTQPGELRQAVLREWEAPRTPKPIPLTWRQVGEHLLTVYNRALEEQSP